MPIGLSKTKRELASLCQQGLKELPLLSLIVQDYHRNMQILREELKQVNVELNQFETKLGFEVSNYL